MNNNLDNDTMENIKNMVNDGNISDAISKISPEMIQNFSKILNNTQNQESTDENREQSNESTKENANFDLNNLDINTIMKMSSALGNSNNKNDPRSNLLNSLKPYLRNSKKNKLDSYINMLNISKLTDIMKKNNNKEN